MCLSPAFGLTLHLIPDSLANPRGLPVCVGRAGEKKKPWFWVEVCKGLLPHTCLHSKTLMSGLKAGPHRATSTPGFMEKVGPFYTSRLTANPRCLLAH